MRADDHLNGTPPMTLGSQLSVGASTVIGHDKRVYEDISGWLHTLLAFSRDFKREHGC